MKPLPTDDFDDDLSDLLSGSKGPIAAPVPAPVQYVPMEKRFEEGCPKCHGSGRFRSWGGRDLGACFNCKGQGRKVFKTSPESRAKARTSNAAKAQDRARQLQAEVLAWQTANPAAWQWMTSNVARGSEFAKSLTEALYKFGSLTDNQLAAIERNVAKSRR
jgi:hypothetical protein